jgi:hypothetical protein
VAAGAQAATTVLEATLAALVNYREWYTSFP